MDLSNERIFEAIRDASHEVFEKSLFIDLHEDSRKLELKLENKYYWVGRISFEGDYKGDILLYSSKEILRNFISDFLGIEDPSDDLSLKDGYNELTNIVAGNILTELSRDGVTFHQGLPETFNYKDFKINSQPDSTEFSAEFSFDGEYVAVQVILLK